MTEIAHKKEPFVLRDITDNTKKSEFDLSNLNTSSTANLIVSNQSNGNNIVRTSDRDQYRMLASLTTDQGISANTWTKINLKVTGFTGATDPSNAWDDTNNRYVVQLSGLHSVTLNVAMNSVGGSNTSIGALCGVVVGESTGSNNAALFGSGRQSRSSRDYVNCFVEHLYLNAGETITPWAYSFVASRVMFQTNDSPSGGLTLMTYMSVQYVGDI